MSNIPPPQEDFYIGWSEQAPPSYERTIRRFVIFPALLTVLVAGLLVFSQRGFTDSVFKLGKLSSQEGILVTSPVPMLKVPQGTDPEGRPVFESIVLIGYRKFGAEATLKALEAQQGEPLEGRAVELRGTHIYHQGKQALELTEGAKAFGGFSTLEPSYSIRKKVLGKVMLQGDILDPKCALGVMKPGYGKPHRSCAIRSLAGGIPAVLRMTDQNGQVNHCLVLGPYGKLINDQLLDYVADQVRICGSLEQQGDWLVFYAEPDIYRLQPHWMQGSIPMCKE